MPRIYVLLIHHRVAFEHQEASLPIDQVLPLEVTSDLKTDQGDSTTWYWSDGVGIVWTQRL